MPEQISYKWYPIEDYTDDPQTLSKTELEQLSSVWLEQKRALEDTEGLKTFNQRLHREWAIETGLLERIYTLDRGVTQILIERGIDASLIPHQSTGQDPTRIVAIIKDHEAAIEGLFAFVKGDRRLSTSYIKELHALLTRNQKTTTAIDQFGRSVEIPLLHGDYKKQPNNPRRPDGSLHQYCPPEQVASEMDRLIEMHLRHGNVPPEVEAAWLHHRFTQIHPFQDGNGRVARCLATLVFLKSGWFPLTIRDVQEERTRYLDALEAADRSDLGPLVSVFAAAQRKAFVQVLSISGQVLQLKRAEQVIAATRNQLESRDRTTRAVWDNAKRTAGKLQNLTNERFKEIARSLEDQTGGYLRDARFTTESEPAGGIRSHYFRWQIVETARRIGYFANTNEYHAWTRLILRAGSQAEILVSFHSTGSEFRGILAVSACFFRREATDEGERAVVDLVPLTLELFQINYREDESNATVRFENWLEEILVKGLELWRQSL